VTVNHSIISNTLLVTQQLASRQYLIPSSTATNEKNYKEARRNARSVALAQEKTRQGFVHELQSTAGKKNVYRVAKQMAKSSQDVVGANCVKDAYGKVLVENGQLKEV